MCHCQQLRRRDLSTHRTPLLWSCTMVIGGVCHVVSDWVHHCVVHWKLLSCQTSPRATEAKATSQASQFRGNRWRRSLRIRSKLRWQLRSSARTPVDWSAGVNLLHMHKSATFRCHALSERRESFRGGWLGETHHQDQSKAA